MTDTRSFSPDWVSPPGDTIEDLLEERGWKKNELAKRTGFTTKHINELVKGRIPISSDAASRLATTLGASVDFWLTREAQYRAALERRKQLEDFKADTPWLKELPIPWLVKHGCLRRFSRRNEQVEECLRFFGVASVDAWHTTYSRPLAAFRASSSEKKVGATAAWLRQIEIEGTNTDCATYDKASFKAALPNLRALTKVPTPEDFVPQLKETCAACGVAIVFLPAPSGCPAYGATRWLTPDKALLALTLRYRTNDQLWFTFFHEACHLLEHGKRLRIIEGLDGLDRTKEDEADRFASEMLIPASALPEISRLRSAPEIRRMAHQLGIAPGILVGRMQREGWIPFSHFNDLKVRYSWMSNDDSASPPAGQHLRS